MPIDRIPSAGIDSGGVGISNLSATGTPSSSTFLRGDNTWNAPATQPAIGVGQTWTNVAGSRSAGTTYTNSTGKPIMVAAYSSSSPSNGQGIVLTISGITVGYGYFAYATNQFVNTVYGIVPDGATYVVTVSSTSIAGWVELR